MHTVHSANKRTSIANTEGLLKLSFIEWSEETKFEKKKKISETANVINVMRSSLCEFVCCVVLLPMMLLPLRCRFDSLAYREAACKQKKNVHRARRATSIMIMMMMQGYTRRASESVRPQRGSKHTRICMDAENTLTDTHSQNTHTSAQAPHPHRYTL